MRRFLPALLALLLLPAAFAFGGPEKEFKAAGFKWSLPDDWEFETLSPDAKRGGFVSKASSTTASVSIWVLSQATDGLDFSERLSELKSAGAEGMGNVKRSKVLDSTLSGVKGKVVVVAVNASGAQGHFRKYVIESGGRFYQMHVQAWHGAHQTQADEINAARAGFRLLKGAKGEDAPETLTEVDEAGDGHDTGGKGGEGPAGGDDSDWPPKGPERDGRTVKMPLHNLEWTLSEESHFVWKGANEDAKSTEGRLAWAEARVKREAKQEFEKGKPDSICFLDLLQPGIQPGWQASVFIKGGHAQKQIEQWKWFDSPITSKTRNWDSKPIGNVKGDIVKFEGKFRDQHSAGMLFVTVLQGKLYMFRARCIGASDVYKHMVPFISKAIKGVKFLDTKQLAAGPLLIAENPTFAAKRGTKVDEEKTYRGPGYTLKKPKGFAFLRSGGDLRFSGEQRSEDGDSYIYFDIRTFPLNRPRTVNPKPEEIANKRAQAWKSGAGDDAMTAKGKRPPYKNGGFGKAKGVTYRFTGSLNKVPFVEEGWVVKHKSNLLWIKVQYGGVDAQAKMKSVFKKLKKGLKYSR